MIKSTNIVKTYEESDKQPLKEITVESHRLYDDFVVLIVGEMRVVVVADDLIAATVNATHSNSH